MAARNLEVDARVAELAASQCGCFSYDQARQLGVSRSLRRRRIATGAWRVVGPNVVGLPSHEASPLRSVWIAHLAVRGSKVSFESAAALRRMDGFPLAEPFVLTSRHRDHRRIPGVFVHQIDDVAPNHVSLLRRLPVTTTARTLVDLAARYGPRRIGDALDQAVVTNRVKLHHVETVTRQIWRRGKPGLRTLAAVLDARGLGYVPPASELERLLFELLEDRGEPPPVRQFPHPGREILRGLVDAAYPEARLIIEVDGRPWHLKLSDDARDKARDRAAIKAGWVTLRYTWLELTGDPDGCIAEIRDIRLLRTK